MPRGKCPDCRVVWAWQGRPTVRAAECLACHKPLHVTSQNSALKVYDAYPVNLRGGRILTCDPSVASKIRREARKRAAGGS